MKPSARFDGRLIQPAPQRWQSSSALTLAFLEELGWIDDHGFSTERGKVLFVGTHAVVATRDTYCNILGPAQRERRVERVAIVRRDDHVGDLIAVLVRELVAKSERLARLVLPANGDIEPRD